MKIRIDSLEDISGTAKEFLKQTEGRRVFAFHGEMGAGKTTFIKAICEELGVDETVASPTFAIVNEYRGGNSEPIYHFDFYRVKTVEEACDFGCEDYFYSGDYCFIEWPDLIERLLPEDTMTVSIKVTEDGAREIEIN